jgi:hypothetical protein
VTLQEQGDEIAAGESSFEPLQQKAQSFAFDGDDNDELNMTPSPPSIPIINVEENTQTSTYSLTYKHQGLCPDQTEAKKEKSYTASCAGNAVGSPRNAKRNDSTKE